MKSDPNEPFVLVMLGKLMAAGQKVRVDVLETTPTRRHKGLLRDVITRQKPDPATGLPSGVEEWLVVYTPPAPAMVRAMAVTLSRAEMDRLTLKKDDKGEWVLASREKDDEPVTEARRQKEPERLGLKAETLLRLIHQQMEKDRPIPTRIDLFGRGLEGALYKVRSNLDHSVTLYAAQGGVEGLSLKELVAQVDAGDRWSSVLTVDDAQMQRLRLTNKGGVVWLVSEEPR